MSEPQPISNQQIEETTQLVLQRPEFADLDPNAGNEVQLIGEFFNSIFSAVQAWLSSLRGNHPEVFVFLIVLVLFVLFFAAAWLARAWARQRVDEARAIDELPVLLRGDPKDLRRRAQDAAAAAQWLDAVRLAFRAVVIEQALKEGVLDRPEKAAAFRRAYTYRELIAEFARSDARRAEMNAVAARLELGLYNNEVLDEQDWQRVQSL